MNIKLSKLLIGGVFPLILGTLVYFFPGQLIFGSVNLDNYIPDFLWSFSLCTMLLTLNIPHDSIKVKRLTALLLSFTFEFAQLYIVPGTFDVLDLLAYTVGIWLSTKLMR